MKRVHIRVAIEQQHDNLASAAENGTVQRRASHGVAETHKAWIGVEESEDLCQIAS